MIPATFFLLTFFPKALTKGLNQSMPLMGHLESAAITQLVECLAVNQDVTGSSPVGGVNRTFFWARSLVRLERPAHNRAVTGSNPVGPTCDFLKIFLENDPAINA